MNHTMILDKPIFSNIANTSSPSINSRKASKHYIHKLQLNPIKPEEHKDYGNILSRLSNLERNCTTIEMMKFYRETHNQEVLELLRRIAELERITSTLTEQLMKQRTAPILPKNELFKVTPNANTDASLVKPRQHQKENETMITQNNLSVDSFMNDAFVDNFQDFNLSSTDVNSSWKITSQFSKTHIESYNTTEDLTEPSLDSKFEFDEHELQVEKFDSTFTVLKANSQDVRNCTFTVNKSYSNEKTFNEISDNDSPHSTPKSLYRKPCSICDKLFTGRHSRLLHMVSHFKDELYKDLENDKSPYFCPITNCAFAATDKGTWAIHYGSVHGAIKRCEKTYLEQNNNNIRIIK